jgi:AraC family transcriptional regulator
MMSGYPVKRHTALDYKKRVCQAMDFISRNLDRELSLEEIAQSACFSAFHFHRIFRIVVGETVGEFIRRLRLEWAANRLLSNRQDSITTIALDCGFSSSQNFAKAFRTHFDISPSEYRKSKRGNMNSNERNEISLQTLYNSIEELVDSTNLDRSENMKAEVKPMPEYHVAYVRKMGPYGQETCEKAFGELMQWAAPRGLLDQGTMLGLYWDNPEVTPAEKCRTDACISVPEETLPEGSVGIQKIEGGPYAVCRFEITADGFAGAWEEAFGWLIKNGYECEDRPCYELYHNNGDEHPEGKWIVDICIPLKEK